VNNVTVSDPVSGSVSRILELQFLTHPRTGNIFRPEHDINGNEMNDITFFQRFERDILAGRKTITIRDESEAHFKEGQVLRVGRYEDDGYFCTINVLSVTPVTLSELTDEHARQENMTLDALREVINAIYPGTDNFYVIAFKLISA